MTSPRDAAGNPTDPTFNSAIFDGSSPLTARSIFTDKGPITRPALTIQSGINATINSADTITLTGAVLTGSHIGLSVTIGNSSINAGTFRITSIVSTTSVRLNSSFSLPDPANGTLTWIVFNPRDGEIADEVSDVTVRVNGNPVTPDAVIGLLGQVVLPTAPSPTDDVKIDYSWIPNPTVEIRRLNSMEFRLNGWNRDGSFGRSQHSYRYNNVLISPSDYIASDIQAPLSQPEQRDLKYRAYERAYTACLNDPTLLQLNAPINKIAFPPLSRTVSSTFVSYSAVALPEADSANPWVRHGNGSAIIEGGTTLVVSDSTSGPFPTGHSIFWTRPIDLMFDHVFAATWRMRITSVPLSQGVFTGVAAGYSDGEKVVVVGYLIDGGIKKLGILTLDSGNDPSTIDAWSGGLTSQGDPTGAPITFDWSIVHSYRLFRDRNGSIKVFVDGDVTESLRITSSEMPFLEELDAPFDTLEGTFFGTLSRPSTNESKWDFYRYAILPTNPLQTDPSVFVSYEGTTPPESASQPWTPIGFAGTETIINSSDLLLDSTSASDESFLIGGSFKGFARIEPLLSASSDVVLDIDVEGRTQTHGIAPNALMAAIDDGSRLVQLCFISDTKAPKLSYGGHALPTAFTPTTWSSIGAQSGSMVGRYLVINDTSTTDGLIYYIEDIEPISSNDRVVGNTFDYVLECRARVISYVPDPSGFCGVTSEVYDGLRTVGILLREDSGIRYVSLHSDGLVIDEFAFEWNDGKPHTYRIVKSTLGDLVSLFVDATLLGTSAYSGFDTPLAGSDGVVSFGSSTPSSNESQSVVEWTYTNAWRVVSSKKFVGLWKGYDDSTLMGYHLPLKTYGTQASVSGNTIADSSADFIAAGIAIGDYLVIDVGTNKGSYTIASVSGSALTINGLFPTTPSKVDYRIPSETDWSASHRYRIVRDPGGAIAVILDTNTTPIIRVSYNELDLPSSNVGLPRVISGGLPAICFGALDPTNISQSVWDYVRFGITRSPTELRIAPHHEFLNQRNVIASPEHLFATLPHSHTDFWSSSTGIPSQLESDFMRDPGLVAYTLLNESTPLVPSTQTFEVRDPQVVSEPISALNRPEDILNSDRDFVLNDGTTRLSLIVPNDVLYSSLEVIETTTGSPDLIAPMDDAAPNLGTLYFQNKHCLSYNGDTLPENDTSPTPWVLDSDNPAHVQTSAFAGVLTYGTDGTGTATIYRNATPLPDSIGMTTQVKFRLKVLNDASGGASDSQIRFGFSAPGLTLSLGLVTTPLGERYVLAIDQMTGNVVGGRPFDFLDGNFHDYRLVKDPAAGLVRIFIDS